MINRKHLKAMLLQASRGDDPISTVPSMAATGWNKVNLQVGLLMTASWQSPQKDGWEPPMGLTIIWISPQEDDHRLEKIDNKWYFSVLMELWWPAAGSQIRANFIIYMEEWFDGHWMVKDR